MIPSFLKSSRRLTPVILTGSAALFSTACVSILPDPVPAPAVYRLTQSPSLASPIAGAPVVRIAMPVTSKALQGTDVVVSTDSNRLAYAAGARWASPVPRLMQEAALQSLGNYEGLAAIAPPTSARADYGLEMTVRAFEADFDRGPETAPLAKLRIAVTLTNLDNRTVAGKKEFYAEQRAAEFRVSSIVAAQDKTAQSVMADMSSWVSETLTGRPTRS